MGTLSIGGECVARQMELGPADLAAIGSEHQVPDVSALVAGREGAALRFRGIAELAGVTDTARLVHVESEDGSFTANVPLEQILSGGLVLYGLNGEELPARYGGPFRLLFVDNDDCSINVKFLSRVEFVVDPGSHTARCAD